MLSKIRNLIKKMQLSYIVSGVVISVIAGFITYYAIPYLPSSTEQEIIFKNIKTNYPINISKRLNEAISNYEAENYKSSLAHLNSISLSLQNSQEKISPRQEALVYSIMGSCHHKLKKIPTSIKYLKKSISLNPTPFSHKLLSEIYFEKFQKDKSEKDLKMHKEHGDKAYKLKLSVFSYKNIKTMGSSDASIEISNLESRLSSLFFKQAEKLSLNKNGYTEKLNKKSINPSFSILENETKKYKVNSSYANLDADSTLININISDKKGKVYIISIGINNYLDKNIKTLRYAEKDSKDIIRSFSNIYGDKVFYNGIYGVKASRRNIIYTINNISKKLSKHDRIIIYYSGHGYSINNIEEKGKDNYIVPVDGDIGDLKGTAISLKYISSIINKNSKSNNLIIIDACNEYIYEKNRNNNFSSINIGNSSYNTTVVYSSSNGQLSAESNKFKNGVFTHFLNKALENTKDIDINSDKKISIRELTSFVNSNMKSYLSKLNVEQNISIFKN